MPETPSSENDKPRGPLFWMLWDFATPVAVLFGLSWWLTTGGRDLTWQESFAGPDGTWPRGEAAFWQFLYRAGPMPATIIAIASVVGLIIGTVSVRWRPWRRVLIYLVLLIAIAPGIITNLILKEHWGRPRPREVEEFGGRSEFESLFAMDLVGSGKSFPCGHATMGFFFVAGYFLLRKTRFGLSLVVLAAAIALGTVMGYMRMIQGGHFATDVVWAGGVVFLTAAGLFHALGLNRRLLDQPAAGGAESRIPLKAKAAGGLAIAALLAGLAFAMPYQETRDYSIHESHPDSITLKPSFKIALGNAKIVPGADLRVTGEAWGHGLPTSKIATRWDEELDGDVLRPLMVQRISGFLTEIHQDLEITIPWERTAAAKFDLGPGGVILQLPAPDRPKRIELRLEETDLVIELEPGTPIQLTADQVDPDKFFGSWKSADAGPRYGLVFTGWKAGKVTFREPAVVE